MLILLGSFFDPDEQKGLLIFKKKISWLLVETQLTLATLYTAVAAWGGLPIETYEHFFSLVLI